MNTALAPRNDPLSYFPRGHVAYFVTFRLTVYVAGSLIIVRRRKEGIVGLI